MRKPRLVWNALMTVLGVLSLLLLLGVLVETPPAQGAEPPAASVLATRFEPAVPLLPETGGLPRAPGEGLRYAAAPAAIAPALLAAVAHCDANGRVVRRRSYVRSFYPLFRLNLACG